MLSALAISFTDIKRVIALSHLSIWTVPGGLVIREVQDD